MSIFKDRLLSLKFDGKQVFVNAKSYFRQFGIKIEYGNQLFYPSELILNETNYFFYGTEDRYLWGEFFISVNDKIEIRRLNVPLHEIELPEHVLYNLDQFPFL